MTILHVTDFHFNKRWFDWLPDNAPAHDLLVMSGDMLNLSDATPHRKQIHWVSDWIRDYPFPISVCSGNHDLEWDAETELWTPAYWLREVSGPNVWSDGQRVTFDGLSLLNISCTTRPKGGEADIWIAHAPPAGTRVGTRANGRDAGDPDLVRPTRRHAPRTILSGHIHDPISWFEKKDSTLLLNPGRIADARIPNHIVFDTESLSCEFITVDRRETMAASATPRAGSAIDDARLVRAVA
jgi:uncharacterized protein